MDRDGSGGRALLVGAPRGLRGPAHDVERMAELLAARGFDIEILTGARATRDGILAGYDRLTDGARPDQAAVFYYSGHGFRAFEQAEGAVWRGISPVDLDESTATDFRGITAWELSIKLAQLTRRTRNVTVILDCCYASRMSRDAADAAPRAVAHPIRLGFAAHLAALRQCHGTAYDAVHPIGNPDAIRFVACGDDESAYEYEVAGQRRGVFTDVLVQVLAEVGGAQVSWAVIAEAVRGRVLHRYPVQRPDIEGPVRRHVFSLAEDAAGDAVAIAGTASGFELSAGRLLSVVPGDVYAVMPPGPATYRRAEAIAEVQVSESYATLARATLMAWTNGHQAVPPGAIAVPLQKMTVRRAVRLDVPEATRAAVTAALDASGRLRVAEPGEAAALATLRVTGDALTIEDRGGSLFPETRFPDQLRGAIARLANLGAAQALRELDGEHGVLASELDIELGAVDRGVMKRLPDHGGALALRDRFYVRVRRITERPLYVHVLNCGLRGDIQLLTQDLAPAGFALIGEQRELVLGQRHDGLVAGVEICWPEGMPRGALPGIDELVVIVTSRPASLQRLETAAEIGTAKGGVPLDSFLVKRLWYFLHPHDNAMAVTQSD